MSNPPGPKEIWAIFCGEINLANTQKLVQGLTAVAANGCERVHLLFHTWGGFVGDGVFIYNTLRSVPLDVVMYNGGQVASAGVIAFLGAKTRKTTDTAVFMIHRSHNSPQFANADKLKSVSDSLSLDDSRVEKIYQSEIKLTAEVIEQHKHYDVYIAGPDAVSMGIATEIGHFAPPKGAQVLNALG